MIYDAFISYSHAADSKLASALQSALHRFAKPWYRLRALRVFRDQTSLSASPALWPAIQTALGEARYFVLLASPDAAGSVWVRRELEYWLGKRSTDTLLIVLTDGELAWDEDTADFNWAVTTVLPESMRRKFRQEPLYLDLRWARTQDHLTLANPRFAEAIADIAAPLRGQAKDDLIGEDIRQHKRTRRVTGGAIFVLVALTVVAVWQAYDATKQRNISEQRTRMVTSQLVADRADNLIAKHPVRAAVLAAEAVNITRRSEKAESHAFAAEATLRRALASMAGRGLGWYEHGVRGVSLSPDGRWLAALDGTERALVWDLSRSEPSLNVISLPGDGEEIKDVLVGPDSNLIATIGSGGARVWDLRKAQLNLRPRHFSSDAMELRKLLFSPNGRWLVGWDYNERIVVWDVAAAVDTGYPEGQRGRELRGHGRFGVDVEFSGDSRWLVTTSDNLARLWDLTQTDSTAIELALPAEDTFYPKLCATSRWLASRKDAGGIRMWDLTADAPAAGHIDLVGDDNKVEELLFAPDCKTMVSLSAGRVLIWNLEKFSVDSESNVAPISIGEQDAPLVHIAISPDGRILAGLTGDDGARTWRLDDESLSVRSFDTTLRDLQFVWFSDNGSWLMAASRDDGIAAWQVEGYKRVEAGGRWPKLSPDGRWLTSISRDHTIWVLDLNERDPLRHARILKGHEDAVNNVSLTADSKWLVSTSSDWTLRLWRLDGRDDPASPRSLRRDAFVKAISPDGSWLLTEEASRRLGLTRLDSGDTAPIELSGVGGSNSAIFSPDSRWLVAGGRPNALLWDLAALGRDSTPIHLEGHASPVIAMGFSPDGRWLATGTRNYSYSLPVNPTVRVWDMESDDVAGSAIHLGELRRTVRSFEFSSDGRWLVARGERRMAHVWDLAAQRHDADPFELPQEDDIRSVAVSPDSRWLVARDDDKSALLWNLGRPEEEPLVLPSFEAPPEPDTGSGPRYMTVLVGHEAIVQTVAFSPDSRWLVTRGHQSFASLWDVASEDPISSRIVLTGHTGQVTSVAFSPDGRWLVTGSSDRTAAVWDMEARNPNANPIFLRAHTAPVFDVSISPDSRWLLTRSDDDTGRVWDLTAADPTKSGFVIGGRDGGVELALFDPNSAWLLVGGKLAREWHIWPLAIDALIGAARRAAGRNLTINEWALHRSDTDYRETFPDLPWPAGPGSGESGR